MTIRTHDVLADVAAEVNADAFSMGLVLHGSRATGVERPDSDYDLIRVVTDEADAADQERVGHLVTIFDAWAAESHPQWYTEAADPFPAGVAERLGGV